MSQSRWECYDCKVLGENISLWTLLYFFLFWKVLDIIYWRLLFLLESSMRRNNTPLILRIVRHSFCSSSAWSCCGRCCQCSCCYCFVIVQERVDVMWYQIKDLSYLSSGEYSPSLSLMALRTNRQTSCLIAIVFSVVGRCSYRFLAYTGINLSQQEEMQSVFAEIIQP